MSDDIKVIYGFKCTYPALVSERVAREIGIRLAVSGELCTKGLTRQNSGCGAPAAYFRIWLNMSPSKRAVRYNPHSNFCEHHVNENAKKSGVPLLDTMDQYQDYLARCRTHNAAFVAEEERKQREAYEEMTRRHAETRRRSMEEFGKVLAASGVRGRVFEKAEGGYLCELFDGSEITPCCWYQALHIVQNLIRGHVAVPPHTDDCTGSPS